MAKMKFSETLGNAGSKNVMPFSEYKDRKGGDWQAYKAYLSENGMLNSSLSVGKSVWHAR